MGAELRIDSAEARELAEQISQITGEAVDHGVVDALRDYLRKVEGEQKKFNQDALAQREDQFYRVIGGSRARWPDFMLSIDHGDLLYDEYGAPR